MGQRRGEREERPGGQGGWGELARTVVAWVGGDQPVRPGGHWEAVGLARASGSTEGFGALACSDLHLWHRAHYFHPIGRVGKLRHGGIGKFAQGHTAGGAGAQA